MQRKKLFLGLVLALLVVGVITVVNYLNSQVGTITIGLNSATPRSAKIMFNGKLVTRDSSSTDSALSYQLKRGEYTMTASQPGYRNFSTKFTLKTGDQLHITARLQLASDPTIKAADQIKGLAQKGIRLSDLRYFYGKTWAVFTVNSITTDPALAAAEYDPATASWTVAAGPGTYFEDGSVKGLPAQVAGYILDQQSQQATQGIIFDGD